GAHSYQLKPAEPEVKMGRGHWGTVDFTTGIISVVSGMPASRQAEVILHEMLHVLLFGQSVKCEEALVSHLSEGLLGILQDNPQLVKHLSSRPQ
ncbi:unnamed protein product, partial [marine sediment metagenome]